MAEEQQQEKKAKPLTFAGKLSPTQAFMISHRFNSYYRSDCTGTGTRLKAGKDFIWKTSIVR